MCIQQIFFCHLRLWWTCCALSFPTLALSFCEMGLMGLRFFDCFSVQLKLHFGYPLKTLFEAKAGFESEKLEWTGALLLFPTQVVPLGIQSHLLSSPSLCSQVLFPKMPPIPKLNLGSHVDRICGKKFVKKKDLSAQPLGRGLDGQRRKY